MKPINEYCDKVSLINEYLSTKVNIAETCPLEPRQEDIINFLQKNGFEEIENFDYERVTDLYDVLRMISYKSEKNKRKEYLISKNLYNSEYRWIRFWFGGEITNENPIFFVMVTEDGHFVENVTAPICALENDRGRIKEIFNYGDFRNYVNEFFRKKINNNE